MNAVLENRNWRNEKEELALMRERVKILRYRKLQSFSILNDNFSKIYFNIFL